LQVVIGSPVYVQVVSRLNQPLKLVLSKCIATPSPSSLDAVQYVLAQNGCPVDSTFQINQPSNFTTQEFQFVMFGFSFGADQTVKFCFCRKLSTFK